MEESVNTSKSELWNLSFRDLFYKYVRFIPLFVLSVAFALLCAYLYLRYTVPVYSVGGSMVIKNDASSGRGDKMEDLLGNNKNLNIQSEMEILKSRPLMKRVVSTLHLQFSYYVKGKIKTLNLYKHGPFLVRILEMPDSSVSFSLKVKFINNNEFRINSEARVFKFDQPIKNGNNVFSLVKNIGSAGTNEFNVTFQSTASAASAYASAIQVQPRGAGTGILTIGMRTPNPQMGADIINKLMEEYSDYSVELKKQSSDQTLAFIDDRMDYYSGKLDSVQKLYLDYQVRYNIIDAGEQSNSYFQTISEADKTINEQNLKKDVADMVDAYLVDKKNTFKEVPVVPSTLGLEDATLNELVTAYNTVQLERQQLLDANVPVANPAVKEATGQIEKLRTSIRENLKNIRSSLGSAVNTFRQRSAVSQSQLKAMPVKVKELAEIEGKLETFRGLYKLLQEKKEETAISRAATTSSSNIIDRAYPSSVPVKPKPRSIQIMAILLGIAIPAMFIFLGEVLNDKVSTRFDIEKITTAPILGEIGHSYSENVLVVNKTTRSMVAEQFRIIRSNLQYVLNKKEKSTILITSSFSGEGKSYISTNMGAVLALAGKKTIILEFDIRKPKVLSGLGIARGPGISNFLIGKAELKDLIRPVPDHENLFVLGCGPIPPNPAELLLDDKVEEMFAWLKENFDTVLVDTAPVGMVSDAMTLSKFADSTLYLVRQGHTFKKQIALIDEFYKENKLPKVSIIINDVKLKPGYGYYGYGRYGYGYGYGYGSYYEEEVAPRNFIEKLINWLDIRRFFKKSKKR
ncbi:MAG: polysaccharide biosynthesis tyrosine autokinase [Bacteroidota bacterium]|nr:polysaccharide biosynthesis tyrosine autokinase [Bacteroidota bacterium]